MATGLWTEIYRPKNIDEYVFRDEEQHTVVNTWIREKSFPHVIFSGVQGTGKTSLAKILINALDIEPYDVLEINASRERGIDEVRDKITNFISMIPFGPFKVVLLDECLDENTMVVIMRNGIEQLIPISKLDDKNDLVKSFNVVSNRIEWKTFELFDKGIQDTIEIEFENNEVVICTPDHKWYVEDNEGSPGSYKIVKAGELVNFEHVLIP